MNVGIIGSRSFRHVERVNAVIRALNKSDVIVTGGASGVDTMAEQIGRMLGMQVEVVHAEWLKYGRSAGPIRNKEIVARCERLFAFWNGKSPGTLDCIRQAMHAGKSVHVLPDVAV